MELSFQSPTLRAYWTDPIPGDLDADEIEAGKQVLENLAAASTFEELCFLYELGYKAGAVTFDDGARVTISCLVEASRVRTENGRVDLSRVTRVQLVSINKLGGAA
ncbi:hypothetical protein [Nesterenkonia ebinurensis]|uniref:hypothetical protein n=1 Tax=Nesterenkonia ebinurensis TaxID=2608252 RepID=UPI00123D666B|nr:hypothetical protein [Nesterenkonia ebinurensis]